METKILQRWEPNAVNWLMGIKSVMHPSVDGSFVSYEDHARQVALLELQVRNLQDQLSANQNKGVDDAKD